MIKMEMSKKHDEARNCSEDCIAAILEHFGQGWEMMHLNIWHFDYKNCDSGSIANKIIFDNKGYYRLTEKYYSIKINEYLFSNYEEDFNFIKSEIENNRPVITSVNGFNLNWLHNYYHRENFLHSCIFNGIDVENQKFYCCDPFFSQEELSITFDEFKESWNYVKKQKNPYWNILQFIKIEDSNKNFYWKDVLREILDYKLKLEYQKSSTDAFNSFKKDLENIDFKSERREENSLFTNPIILKFWKLSLSYRKVIRILEFLERENSNLKFEIIKTDLEETANQWAIIRGILIKFFLLNNRKFLGIISEKIDLIANLELKVIEDLTYFIEHGSERIDNSAQIDNISNNLNTENYQFKTIKSSSYNNNKGIGFIHDNANFDNADFYYQKDGFPCEIKLSYENMEIPFAIELSSDFDNISTANQRIVLENEKIYSIFFLGAAENGDYKDNILINYSDGTTHKKIINFTDWFHNPIFGEQIAWSGPCVSSSKTILPKVHLFAHKIDLDAAKPCKEIVLPYCPNLHIFAITIKHNL